MPRWSRWWMTMRRRPRGRKGELRARGRTSCSPTMPRTSTSGVGAREGGWVWGAGCGGLGGGFPAASVLPPLAPPHTHYVLAGSVFWLPYLPASPMSPIRLERLEFLISRRPELLNSVMLRQNPHNVAEWHKRVKLFDGNPTKQVGFTSFLPHTRVLPTLSPTPLNIHTISYFLLPSQILTYTEAVKTVDIDKAIGKPHSLWCAFAKFYERHGDVPNGRVVFEKAIQVRCRMRDRGGEKRGGR